MSFQCTGGRVSGKMLVESQSVMFCLLHLLRIVLGIVHTMYIFAHD